MVKKLELNERERERDRNREVEIERKTEHTVPISYSKTGMSFRIYNLYTWRHGTTVPFALQSAKSYPTLNVDAT